MVTYKKCCICGRLIESHPHDAKPYKNGICCGVCYANVVLPAKHNLKIKNKKY